MPVTRTVAAALVGVVVLGFVGATAWGDITVQSWSLTTMAQAGAGPGVQATDTIQALPWTPPPRIVDHSAEGGTSIAESRYDFSAVGDVGLFRFDFEHERGEPYLSQSQSDGDLFFTGDMGLIYTLEGRYTFEDGYQWISLNAVLEDVSDPIHPVTVFEYDEAAFHTGGNAPVFTFNRSGTLLVGHDYRLHYDYWTYARDYADSGAWAVGYLDMNLNLIPAPGAALLGVIGLGMVGWARRRIA